ncbi:hypothetical protein UPYG_G00231860 [Umbra pygmaea]|uniref:ELM2 and SANT domain-containing protein 1 n=1 Tax=Umbra pygmaea TaxID=75934 RepID=A0ABD0WXX5_UMBPY
MSLPPQQKPSSKRTGKRISFFQDQGLAMKETSSQQHPEGSYYSLGAPASGPCPGQSEATGTVTSTTSNPEAPHTGMYLNSVIFSPEKGDQSRGHYQQTVPMKWAHQDTPGHPPPQQRSGTGTWTQGANVANWGQNFAPYLGGVSDTRSQAQAAFVKQPIRDGPPTLQPQQPQQPQPPRAVEKQPAQQTQANSVPARVEAYRDVRDVTKPRGLEWEQQQKQSQSFSQTLKPGALNAPPHSASNPVGSSVLQPFQLAFGQPKQHLAAGYYQVFQGGNRTLPNLNYNAQQPKPQQHAQPRPQQQQEQQLQQHPQRPPADTQLQPPQLHLQPRRSRRLSKEGGSPPGDNPFLIPSDVAQNGGSEGSVGAPKVEEVQVPQAAQTGVIQSTRRKRRVSQEVNLETLAQKASEMESLPPHIVKEQPHRPWSPQRPQPGQGTMDRDQGGQSTKRPRDESMMPLVIPVSVPVRRPDPHSPSSSPEREHSILGTGWPQRPSSHLDVGSVDRKPSVIVTRRRSLRNSLSESSGQNGGTEGEKDDDAKKSKRRPRPDPLFIPPPKPGTFMAPVYSSIMPYQSHLRSPIQLIDNPMTMPPYTPPPILSPVREGTGLYFSTFLSSTVAATASSQGLPPPITPKSATRSLLRSNSIDITPPILSAIGEATPVSIEPRINIGVRYQAEIPELRPQSQAQYDHRKADLVWAPLNELEAKPGLQGRVDDLMHLACSSALHGGGTNQELALHCLHECKGDIMGALALLMLQKPIFSKNHYLEDYHYSGSDSWTSAERRDFNKGIAAYKKDFFMVQKLVCSKTVAQCVEFYYTYKKQVKIGRNGALLYGEADPPDSRNTEEELDQKSSQRLESRKEEEDNRKWEGSADRTQRGSSPSKMTQTLQGTENAGGLLVLKSQDEMRRDQVLPRVSQPPPSAPSKPRSAPKASVISGTKGPAGPEGEFPCKKCGRIFYKVKSRSAHMKSHAEQEKKAAALRQKEAEERAAAQAAAEAAALLAAQQNGAREDGATPERGDSTNDDSSEEDNEEDEDWH